MRPETAVPVRDERESKLDAKRTRREFLKLAGLGTAGIALAGLVGCETSGGAPETTRAGVSTAPTTAVTGPEPTVSLAELGPEDSGSEYVREFRSRPGLRPPTVRINTSKNSVAPGYVFIAPKKGEGQYGAMVVDGRGRLIWFKPVEREGDYAMDCKVQAYNGEPVLTYWEGLLTAGYGDGDYRILDASYKEIARVRADGFNGDHHEFLITDRGTALITIYDEVNADLSWAGGEAGGAVIEGVIQEIDIETGEVLFEWHSLDHVGLEESYTEFSPDETGIYEYFHINSIDVDDDENLLVSAKGVHAVYKIDRETGEVIWRLGGKNSDFEMGPNTRFVRQHDARRQADGTITLFDNGDPETYQESYGKVLALDVDAMTVELADQYTYPDGIYAENQANMQVLPNGNVFIGWGSEPFFSEFNDDGELLFHGSLPPEAESYRAFRFPWAGRPGDKPAIAAEGGPDGEATLYASWNGATGISTWQVLTGPGPESLKPAGNVTWEGFETAIELRDGGKYVTVQARDSAGEVLGSTEAIEL